MTPLKWHTNLRFENTVYKIYLKNPKSRAIINVQLNEKTVVSMIYVTFYRYYVSGGDEVHEMDVFTNELILKTSKLCIIFYVIKISVSDLSDSL